MCCDIIVFDVSCNRDSDHMHQPYQIVTQSRFKKLFAMIDVRVPKPKEIVHFLYYRPDILVIQ